MHRDDWPQAISGRLWAAPEWPWQGGAVGDDVEVLAGGVANAGVVVRVGSVVLRPSNPHSATILSFLAELCAREFDGAPGSVGVDPDGRERLRFTPDDVAIPRFPDWVHRDDALASSRHVNAEIDRRFDPVTHSMTIRKGVGCIIDSEPLRDGVTQLIGVR